jgi:ABC-type polysaccharide/polyol phosphate export permease
MMSGWKFFMSSRLRHLLSRFLVPVIGPIHWHFLGVVVLLVRRELKVKYRESVLGYCWSMLNPLLSMLVLTLVFSSIFKIAIEDYCLYVLSGVMVWNMTSFALNLGTQSLVANANLLKKIRIPIWVFPCVSLGAAITNFFLTLIPFAIIFLGYGRAIPGQLWLFPLVLLLYAAFLFGMILVLSILNAFFRDVGHVLEPLLQILMYSSPVIYQRSMLSPEIAKLFAWNPFAHFIEAFHAALWGGTRLTATDIGLLTLLAGTSLGIGVAAYRRVHREVIFHV